MPVRVVMAGEGELDDVFSLSTNENERLIVSQSVVHVAHSSSRNLTYHSHQNFYSIPYKIYYSLPPPCYVIYSFSIILTYIFEL